MKDDIISSRALAKALTEEGLLPAHCTLIEVIVPPAGAPTLRYSVLVGKEDLPKLARALLRAGDEAILEGGDDGRPQ